MTTCLEDPFGGRGTLKWNEEVEAIYHQLVHQFDIAGGVVYLLAGTQWWKTGFDKTSFDSWGEATGERIEEARSSAKACDYNIFISLDVDLE